MDPSDETRRLLRWLRLMVRISELTQGEIERRAAFSNGYLSRILGGYVEISFRHLLGILEAIDIQPADFFFQLFPRRRDRTLEIFWFLQNHHPVQDKPLVVDLARLLAFGIESTEEVEERLCRCEDTIVDLVKSREHRQ